MTRSASELRAPSAAAARHPTRNVVRSAVASQLNGTSSTVLSCVAGADALAGRAGTVYSAPMSIGNLASVKARLVTYHGLSAVFFVLVAAWPTAAVAQVTATARAGATPPWNKGIQPVTPESYDHAIECGKQEGDDPPCVFWDTGLCKNDDFTLSAYTGYKQVAYEVWSAVRQGRPAPQPNYQAAQRTRVTIGVEAAGATNTLTDFILKRGGQPVRAVDRYVSGGRFTFDYPAWAPTAAITLDIIGAARTVSCTIPPGVLQQFR